MSFRIRGLSATPFKGLFGLSAEDLAAQGIQRYVAEPHSAYPDRIEMRDAAPGETLLLLNHEYQLAQTPYRARHATFIERLFARESVAYIQAHNAKRGCYSGRIERA